MPTPALAVADASDACPSAVRRPGPASPLSDKKNPDVSGAARQPEAAIGRRGRGRDNARAGGRSTAREAVAHARGDAAAIAEQAREAARRLGLQTDRRIPAVRAAFDAKRTGEVAAMEAQADALGAAHELTPREVAASRAGRRRARRRLPEAVRDRGRQRRICVRAHVCALRQPSRRARWRRIEMMRDFGAMLDAVRASPLGPGRGISDRTRMRTPSNSRCAPICANGSPRSRGGCRRRGALPSSGAPCWSTCRCCNISRAAARRHLDRDDPLRPALRDATRPPQGRDRPPCWPPPRRIPTPRRAVARGVAAAPAGPRRTLGAARGSHPFAHAARRDIPLNRRCRRLGAASRLARPAGPAVAARNARSGGGVHFPRALGARLRATARRTPAPRRLSAPAARRMIRPRPARWFETARRPRRRDAGARGARGARRGGARGAADRVCRLPWPTSVPCCRNSRSSSLRYHAYWPATGLAALGVSRASRRRRSNRCLAQVRRVGAGRRAGHPAPAARRGGARRARALASRIRRDGRRASSTSHAQSSAGPLVRVRLFVFPPDTEPAVPPGCCCSPIRRPMAELHALAVGTVEELRAAGAAGGRA